MAGKQTRRRFTAEFKAQAVKRLAESGRGLSEVATELGLSTGQLSTWRTEQLAAGSAEMLAARKAEEAETLSARHVNQWRVSTLISAVTHWIFTFPLGPLSALTNSARATRSATARPGGDARTHLILGSGEQPQGGLRPSGRRRRSWVD